jgi:hypothetical protein
MIVFSGIFWGVVLILLGIGVIVNITLKTRIPFFRIFFAILLIYIGISALIGPRWRPHHRRWERRSRVLVTGPSEKHDILFGDGEIDLTGIQVSGQTVRAEVDVVFGRGLVRLNPDVPTRVEVSSAFAEAKLPDGSRIAMGDHVWRSPGLDESKPHLAVEADVVFGSMEIVTGPARVPQPVDSTPGRKETL